MCKTAMELENTGFFRVENVVDNGSHIKIKSESFPQSEKNKILKYIYPQKIPV